VNHELDRIRKETIVPELRYYPETWMEALSKTTRKLSQDNFFLFFSRVEPESTWYCGHCLAYSTAPDDEYCGVIGGM
jgi:hypothetical protein